MMAAGRVDSVGMHIDQDSSCGWVEGRRHMGLEVGEDRGQQVGVVVFVLGVCCSSCFCFICVVGLVVQIREWIGMLAFSVLLVFILLDVPVLEVLSFGVSPWVWCSTTMPLWMSSKACYFRICLVKVIMFLE